MTRFKIGVYAIFFWSSVQNLTAQWQQDLFDAETYQTAIQVLENEKNTILHYFSKEEALFALAIVFPEMLRYNTWKDYAETTTLEVLYIQYGKQYADFSIGYFQMKPSFIEKLESYAQENKLTHFSYLYQYSEKEQTAIRALRLQKLQSFEGQLQYLSLFCAILDHRFQTKKWKNAQEKLRFFASAYNYGFLAPESEIWLWAEKSAFPEAWYPGQKQYNYTQIAVDFFERENSLF